MSTALTTPTARAASYAVASHGAGTIAAYRSAWKGWEGWCAAYGATPLPADPARVAEYVSTLADLGLSASTIGGVMAAIKRAHELAGRDFDIGFRGRLTLKGIRNTLGRAPKHQAVAITPAQLGRMLAVVDNPRDRAMLLIGYGAALRRSEIVGLDVRDIAVHPRGLVVTVRRSKTDQEGLGRVVGVARGLPGFCPVEAFETLMASRGDCDGALFVSQHDGARLSDKAVARLVKGAAQTVGLRGVSAHSLRAGFITAAARAGASLASLAGHARHARVDTTAGYIRAETVWDENPSVGVFQGGGL